MSESNKCSECGRGINHCWCQISMIQHRKILRDLRAENDLLATTQVEIDQDRSKLRQQVDDLTTHNKALIESRKKLLRYGGEVTLLLSEIQEIVERWEPPYA